MSLSSPPVRDESSVQIAADLRKTAVIADANRRRTNGAVQVNDAETARLILRNQTMRQAGFSAEMPGLLDSLGNLPVIMLHGEAHRRQRTAAARFFSPRMVNTRYIGLMEATADRLIAGFRAIGWANLEGMTMDLAMTIAADIVGLTNSKRAGMMRRLNAFFGDGGRLRRDPLSVAVEYIRSTYVLMSFYWRDVRPAIKTRQRQKGEDVISHLLEEGYSAREILVECATYAAAGMVTTREFITIAFWHLMENHELKSNFLEGDRKAQLSLLEEILRTEPIVGVIARRSTEAIELPSDPPRSLPAGTLFEIDIRSANADTTAVGSCPFVIDTQRPVMHQAAGSMFSFGDGAHRCPGAQVALLETSIFLDRLLRLPGLRMEQKPTIGWVGMIEGYDVSGASITCDRS